MIHSEAKPHTENIHSQTNGNSASRTQTGHQELSRQLPKHERSPHMSSTQLWESGHGRFGSQDGQGAGDHDQPYRFGWRPRASVPYPFNTRQYARLLLLRGRVQDSLGGQDDLTRAA
jgi:hypothetical protein